VQNRDTGAEAPAESLDQLGVRAISGTNTKAWPPPAIAAAMTRKYTSVLPLPVTPYSKCAANRPNEAVMCRRPAFAHPSA